MARGKKIVRKKTARKKIVSKTSAAKRSTKATKKVARKKTAKKAPVKKISAKKTGAKKKASARKTAARKTTAKKAAAKKVVVKKTSSAKPASRAVKKAVAAKRGSASKVKQVKASASPNPPSRRQAPRNSSGRRLAARAPVSRAQLVKKTFVEAKRAKPANAQQKAVQKAKQLRARKKALAAKDNRLPAQRSPSARVRRSDGPEAPSSRRLSIRAAVTRETSRSPAQRATVGEPPFRLHQLGIRDEHPTDRAAILALLVEAFGESAQAEMLQALRLEDRIGGVLVAQHGERIVGCGALFLNAVESSAGDIPIAEIGVLAVAPSLQRKGIGTQLVLAMIESARASGAKALLAQRLDGLLADLGFSADSVANLDRNEAVLALKLAEDEENELAGRLKQPLS
jgi:predicted N-acetyltransferase YhbS